MASRTRLSPSTIGIFEDCPHCFWLHMNGQKRPRGPFPSLPNGIDRVLKSYCDLSREQGVLPPELAGQVKGKLFPDQALMDRWRNWRTGLRWDDPETGGQLSGALDDCLVEETSAGEQLYMPLDFKTRGVPPYESTSRYYQTPLEAYALLLQENGYDINGISYLAYYWPREAIAMDAEHSVGFSFEVRIHEVRLNIERARRIFRQAVTLLDNEMPPPQAQCDFCAWAAHPPAGQNV